MNILRAQQRRKGLAYALHFAPFIANRLFELSKNQTAKHLIEAFYPIYFRRLEDELKNKFKRLTDQDVESILDHSRLAALAELTRLDEQSQGGKTE